MLLKMKTSLCGPAIALAPNDEHDFTDTAEALRLVAAGYAVPANEAAQAELDAARGPKKPAPKA
jgi:hypothetical protein